VINKELEKRMVRAQLDPHFIFNALNAIQHLITINDKTAALKYLSKFSKLVRQTLENSVSHKVPVADEVRLLRYYLELESLRFDHQFAFAIEVDEGLDIYNVEIPFLLLQPYVENAIVHGLRHKKGSGILKIQLQGEKDYLHCIVEDNGVGRKEAAKIMVNSGKSHTSRGMSVTDQRLATLNTDQERKTQLKITDLYDNQQKAAGTKVEVFIPLELN
jgi:LytS/YehU family sensor histidine kinase